MSVELSQKTRRNHPAWLITKAGVSWMIPFFEWVWRVWRRKVKPEKRWAIKSVKVDRKSGKNTTIPKLLAVLKISDLIVKIDGIGSNCWCRNSTIALTPIAPSPYPINSASLIYPLVSLTPSAAAISRVIPRVRCRLLLDSLLDSIKVNGIRSAIVNTLRSPWLAVILRRPWCHQVLMSSPASIPYRRRHLG